MPKDDRRGIAVVKPNDLSGGGFENPASCRLTVSACSLNGFKAGKSWFLRHSVYLQISFAGTPTLPGEYAR